MRWQFSIRGLLLFTAYVALVLAIGTAFVPLGFFVAVLAPAVFRRTQYIQGELSRKTIEATPLCFLEALIFSGIVEFALLIFSFFIMVLLSSLLIPLVWSLVHRMPRADWWIFIAVVLGWTGVYIHLHRETMTWGRGGNDA